MVGYRDGYAWPVFPSPLRTTFPAAISLRATTMSSFFGELTKYSDPSRICRTRFAVMCTSRNRFLTRFRQSSMVILAKTPPPLSHLKFTESPSVHSSVGHRGFAHRFHCRVSSRQGLSPKETEWKAVPFPHSIRRAPPTDKKPVRRYRCFPG